MRGEPSVVFASQPIGSTEERLDVDYHHPKFDNVRSYREKIHQRLSTVVSKPRLGLSQSGLASGLVGFLRVEHIRPDGRLEFDPPSYIAECPDEQRLSPGDILIARTGYTLGKAAEVPERFGGFAFGSFCMKFSVLNTQAVRPGFVVRFINSGIGKSQVEMLRTGSDKYNINSDQLHDIAFPMFSPEQQDAIIEAVQPIEEEAELLEKQALQAQDSAGGLFLDELGIDVRDEYPDYFFKTGEEGRSLWFSVPSDQVDDRMHYLTFHPRTKTIEALTRKFATGRLGDLVPARPVSSGVQPTEDDLEEGGPVSILKTVNLRNHIVADEGADRTSEEFYDAHPEAQVIKDDILVAATGYVSMGKVDVLSADRALISGELLSLRVSEGYDPRFVCYFLRSHLGKVQFEQWFSGSSGQIHIYGDDIENFTVPTSGVEGVPLEEQQRIASAVAEKHEAANTLYSNAASKWQEASNLFASAIGA